MKHLEDSFLDELLKASLQRKAFFQTVLKHMKVNYIPDRPYQDVWNEMVKYYRVENKPPSVGILSQKLSQNEDGLEALGNIKSSDKPDFEGVIRGFEEFIRQSKFVELYDEIGDVYNEGNKEKAYSIFTTGADDLYNFSLKGTLHDKVFSEFDQRQVDRLMEQTNTEVNKAPSGIDLLDYYMGGGTEFGEASMFLGDSGVGKSQFLIQQGIASARRGIKVAHFQAEGTKKQVRDRYDSAWTATLYKDMKFGNISDAKFKAFMKIVKKASLGEIYIESREKFDAWTMVDVRNSLMEMFKLYGHIGLVLLDYLELFNPGNGINYYPSDERFRQSAVARACKDIAVEFNTAVVTVTQATSIPPQSKEDSGFHMTRWHLSEDKGKIKPFDNFATFNQTSEEYENKELRIYTDKFREHKSGQIIPINQNFARARFYDRLKTIDTYGTEEKVMIGII